MTKKDKYFLTKLGYQRLQEEYKRLKSEEKLVALERVKKAREMGNLEDNQEYEAARVALNLVEGRILELEDILDNAKIIAEEREIKGKITLGSRVTVEVKGAKQALTIVGSIEADPSQGKISHKSPVGSKLLGLKKGDVVKIELPNTIIEYKILKIHGLAI